MSIRATLIRRNAIHYYMHGSFPPVLNLSYLECFHVVTHGKFGTRFMNSSNIISSSTTWTGISCQRWPFYIWTFCVQEISDSLASIGDLIPRHDLFEILLESLPIEFNTVIAAINHGPDHTSMSEHKARFLAYQFSVSTFSYVLPKKLFMWCMYKFVETNSILKLMLHCLNWSGCHLWKE